MLSLPVPSLAVWPFFWPWLPHLHVSFTI